MLSKREPVNILLYFFPDLYIYIYTHTYLVFSEFLSPPIFILSIYANIDNGVILEHIHYTHVPNVVYCFFFINILF